MIILKTSRELSLMKEAGRISQEALLRAGELVKLVKSRIVAVLQADNQRSYSVFLVHHIFILRLTDFGDNYPFIKLDAMKIRLVYENFKFFKKRGYLTL